MLKIFGWLFAGNSLFNQDINNWDVGSGTTSGICFKVLIPLIEHQVLGM